MSGWTPGAISFSSDGSGGYNVSYTAPGYVFPSGSTNRSGPSVVESGATHVACGTYAAQTYIISYKLSGTTYTDFYDVGGTSPACAPPPTYPPSWSDNALATPIAGVAYSDSVSATNSPSYSVSSGSLPSGISLNSSSGAVTGTPTVSGSYSFTITASNGDGSVSQSFSWTIGGGVKVWNGTSWASKAVQVWNGSAWVTKPVYVWNGSNWGASS
jgi:hypothetical protein